MQPNCQSSQTDTMNRRQPLDYQHADTSEPAEDEWHNAISVQWKVMKFHPPALLQLLLHIWDGCSGVK